jgi:DNA-binding FadR family transcriptional regulator
MGGALSPGESLPGERRLAVDLGVNRGAVREGLKRLEQAGFIAIQHGGPTRVLDFRRCPALSLLVDALEMPHGGVDWKVARSYLELHRCFAPHVARLAAERSGAKLAQALESHLRTLAEADEQDDAGIQNLGRAELWCLLARGSQNPAYALSMSAIRHATRRILSRSEELARLIPSASLARLSELAFAVVAGDGDAAEACAEAVVEALHRTTGPEVEGGLANGATLFAGHRLAEPPLPGPQESVSLQVFTSLREEILSERLPAGAALPGERTLATRFGVNRGAVREALKRLEQLDLIAIQHGGATRVLDYRDSPSLELLAHSLYGPSGRLRGKIVIALVEMRTRALPDLARLATARAGPLLREPLQAALDELDAAPDAEAAQMARHRFWDVLAFGSDNLAYRFLLHVIHLAERGLRGAHRELAASLAAPAEELRRIAAAVVSRDGPLAVRETTACASGLHARVQRTLLELDRRGELD